MLFLRTQAVELDPDNPSCHIGKGALLVELKQYAAAVLSFREAYARRRSYAVYKGMLIWIPSSWMTYTGLGPWPCFAPQK